MRKFILILISLIFINCNEDEPCELTYSYDEHFVVDTNFLNYYHSRALALPYPMLATGCNGIEGYNNFENVDNLNYVISNTTITYPNPQIYPPGNGYPVLIWFNGNGFLDASTNRMDEISPTSVVSVLPSQGFVLVRCDTNILNSENSLGVYYAMDIGAKVAEYIYCKADGLLIDKDRIGVGGNSAGAGTSLNILTKRNSDFIKTAYVLNPQATYNIDRWSEIFNQDLSTLPFYNSTQEFVYGVSDVSQITENMKNRVDFLTATNSTPIYLQNTEPNIPPDNTYGSYVHHPLHVETLKNYFPNHPNEHLIYSTSGDQIISMLEFLRSNP